MGDIGKVSRLLSLFFGSPFTYVSLGKPIAAGQLKLDELKSMLMRSG
jgi:3-dehydroquinate dehydratase-1